jgi:methionyl aminopeptidase
MSIIKNQQDLDNIKMSARILASGMKMVEKLAKPGVSCGDLNQQMETFILDHGGKPAFKGLYGYPYTLISELDDEVVHGLSPKSKIIPETCIISFDCGVIYQGMYSDMAILMTFGNVAPEVKMLAEKTKESLWAGIKAVKAGKKVGDIGYAVDKVLSQASLGNVTDFGGHGLGYKPHDEPFISHKGTQGKGATLMENMVICIEPMVTLGSGEVIFEETAESGIEVIKSKEGVPSAHIEHMVLVTKKGYEVLTEITEEQILT